MISNPFQSRLTFMQRVKGLGLSDKQPTNGKSHISNPFQRKYIIQTLSSSKRPVSSKSFSHINRKIDMAKHFQFFNIKTNYHQLNNRQRISKSLKSQQICKAFKKDRQIQIYKKYINIFGYDSLIYKPTQAAENKEYFKEQKSQLNKKAQNKNIFKQSLDIYGQKQNRSQSNFTKEFNCRKQNKSKKQLKTKKMLSWNISNEDKDQKDKRRNSQKSIAEHSQNNSIKIVEQPLNVPSRFTFGVINSQQTNENKMRKSSSYSSNYDNCCKEGEDFIIEKKGCFKMSYNSNKSNSFRFNSNLVQNKYRGSYQSQVYQKQYNNLRYDSNLDYNGYRDSGDFRSSYSSSENRVMKRGDTCERKLAGRNQVQSWSPQPRIIYNNKVYQLINEIL